MNWNLCALCQADGLDLIDPRNNRNSGVCGYTRLVTNINAFVNEGLCLPSKIKVSINDLKGTSDILTNLQHNNAYYSLLANQERVTLHNFLLMKIKRYLLRFPSKVNFDLHQKNRQ